MKDATAFGLEHKFCRLDAPPEVTDGTGIAGYASVFGARDQGGDVVAPGAYAASLKALAAAGRRVKMLWQHDPTQPIGIWDEVREDAKGLFVKGRILPEIARGREAAALLAAGAIDGLSIGYRTRKAAKAAQGGRLLSELELWEVSLVTFPMLPEARIGAGIEARIGAKAEDPAETALRDMAEAIETARQRFRDEVQT